MASDPGRDPGRGPGPDRGVPPNRDWGPCPGADDGPDPEDCTHTITERYGYTDLVGDAYWTERCSTCGRTLTDKWEQERDERRR